MFMLSAKMFNSGQSLFMRCINHLKFCISELINKLGQSNQTSVPLVWHVLKCWYVLVTGCYHDVLEIRNVTLRPGCLYMKELGSSHKGIDMGITHVVSHVHVYTMFYRVFPQWSNDHHSGVPSGSPLFFFLIFYVFWSTCWSCSRSWQSDSLGVVVIRLTKQQLSAYWSGWSS